MALAPGQLQPGLLQQGLQRGVEGVAHVEVFTFVAQVRRAQAHGKQRALQLLDDLRQCIARRQLAPTGFAGSLLGVTPFVTHGV